ncbi:MAG: oligosaccharide flippase family protein [Bacteroidaceae bacterium]|nr:oligosaccharide flippase family protein [Bacteroidaceae bacterium]
MSRNSSYRHILKYTGLFGSLQVVNVLTSVLRNKAAAVLIEKYGQGISELFNSTINLVNTATTLVIPISIIRRLSILYEKYGCHSTTLHHEIKAIRSWNLLSGIVAMIIVVITAPLISQLTFDSPNFTRSYIFLSPMLVMLSINTTEIAILKATRRLKQLVKASLIGSISTLVICVICYYFWKLRGIVISFDLSLFVMMLLNLRQTISQYPYKLSLFNTRVLKKVTPLIKLSLSIILAAIAASLAEYIIKANISHSGSIENVGLYSAGFALTVTYTRFIFTAMDADYYPRLSACCTNLNFTNVAINRQITVCTNLITPFLIAFILFLPYIIPLIYTSKYLEIQPMIVYATFFVFGKALVTPVAYLALAHGDTKTYLMIEIYAALLLSVCVTIGYNIYGLAGCGIGLTASNFIESATILILYYKLYKIRFSLTTITATICQFILLSTAIYIINTTNGNMKYVIAATNVALSICLSYYIFRKNDNNKS